MPLSACDGIGAIEAETSHLTHLAIDQTVGWPLGCCDEEGAEHDVSAPQGLISSGANATLPYYVSALLPSDTPRWNEASGVGTPVNVTFSFMTQAPSYASWADSYDFAPFSESQKSAARAALATWSDVANITFTEVSEPV